MTAQTFKHWILRSCGFCLILVGGYVAAFSKGKTVGIAALLTGVAQIVFSVIVDIRSRRS